MNAPHNWKEERNALNRFIADNPEIVINPSEISIPQNVRDEFYKRFDQMRMAIIEEAYSALADDILALCKNYVQVEQEVIELLGVKSISTPVDLFSFLHQPKEGMMRIIYNRSFDLIQGKIDEDEFEKKCDKELKNSSTDLFRIGYEWWATLSIIKLLEPDEAYSVDFDVEYKPILVELQGIAFGRQAHHPTIRVPEFVLHSRKIGGYVALKMALAREVETYVVQFKPAVRPRKRTGDTSLVLDSRVLLLSFLKSKEDIPILADIYERTRTSPDWIIEYRIKNEFSALADIEEAIIHYDALAPKRGSCVIVMDPDICLDPENIPEKIFPFAVGLDASKLQVAKDKLADKAQSNA